MGFKPRSRTLYFVGPWDLHQSLACVPRPGQGDVLLVESIAKRDALPYHRQKLALVLSAIHHFAAELESEGHNVAVRPAASYAEAIQEMVKSGGYEKVVALKPREWGLAQSLHQLSEDLSIPLELHDDGGIGGHFLLSRAEFEQWANGRKQYRMHHFYSMMRKRTSYLMEDGKPIGGKLSFDSENRQHAKDVAPPPPPQLALTDITIRQLARVEKIDGHWGELTPFRWPVTRSQALAMLEDFIEKRLAEFGPYQDAMLRNQDFMWHSLLSSSLNLSLLTPGEVCDRVVAAYHSGQVPLQSAEGLIRQIIGWREFIRGMYWLRMPEMRNANHLSAHNPLPDFYWDETKTEMSCMNQSVRAVRETGYAHHIQRLMVLGNYGLLAGIDPIHLSHWFWAGFVDAYEWVELPNVVGMALYGDPSFTTKPYAASGAYIQRMSDYCGDCKFSVRKKTGPDSCPFNSLFWHFVSRNRKTMNSNPRTRNMLRMWDKKSDREREEIIATAESHLAANRSEANWAFHDDAG